jgi:hypothetical protein
MLPIATSCHGPVAEVCCSVRLSCDDDRLHPDRNTHVQHAMKGRGGGGRHPPWCRSMYLRLGRLGRLSLTSDPMTIASMRGIASG